MISWLLLAPLVGGASAVTEILPAYRRWRRDEIDLSELLESVTYGSVMLGVGAAAMVHPIAAGFFIATTAVTETRQALRQRRLRLRNPGDNAG